MVSIGLPALAHAQLIDAEPKANQVLSSSPTQFKLTFSDTLINLGPTSNWLRVESAQGELVSADAVLNGNQLSALPLQALKPGKYQLIWRVLSEDGHRYPDIRSKPGSWHKGNRRWSGVESTKRNVQHQGQTGYFPLFRKACPWKICGLLLG
jgi:methionine-rich copper-binding protein CopC